MFPIFPVQSVSSLNKSWKVGQANLEQLSEYNVAPEASLTDSLQGGEASSESPQ